MTPTQQRSYEDEGSLLGSEQARQKLEAEANRLLATPKAERITRRIEAGPVEGAGDVLDFIVNGGAFRPKAVLMRVACMAVAANLLDRRAAARMAGCSLASLWRAEKSQRHLIPTT